MTEVLGYTTSELVELMMHSGIHTSVDQFKRLVVELQQRALRSMLGAEGVVEVRVIEETEGGACD